MTTDLEHRLRADLTTVDDVELDDSLAAQVDAVLRRRRTRQRIGVVAACGALIGTGVVGLALAGNDDPSGPVTTPTVPPATASTTVPSEADGAWRLAPIASDPRGDVVGPAAVWTGNQVLSVGGSLGLGDERTFALGFSEYRPTVDWWRMIATPGPLNALAGQGPALVETIETWTGSELLLITDHGVGFRYDPAAAMSAGFDLAVDGEITAGTPHVWTGTEWLVWPDGAGPSAYDPATNTWREIATPPIAGRSRAASVWSGSEWIVWGGRATADDSDLGDGAAYDPVTGTWRTIADAPIGPRWVGGVFAQGEMFVLTGARGPDNGPFALDDGAAYDPATDTWRVVAPGPAHPGNQVTTSGEHVFVYAKGGVTVYDIAADTWDDACCVDGFASGPLLWASDRLIVLGGTTPYAVIEN